MELSEITIGLTPNWELIEAKLNGTAYIKGGAIYYPKGLILGRESIIPDNHLKDALHYLMPKNEPQAAKELRIVIFPNIDLKSLFRNHKRK